MKRFLIKSLIAICLLPLIIVPIELCIWHIYSENVDLKTDERKHLAVFGNSMGECSINDSILVDFQNCCCSGLDFVMGKNVIKAYLKQNKQVDTVFLTLGVYSFTLNERSSKEDMDVAKCHSSATYIAFLGTEIFDLYGYKNISNCFLSGVENLSGKPHYGYLYLKRNNLNDRNATWSRYWFDSTYPVNADSLSFEEEMESSTLIRYALNDIISYCHATNRVVVIYQPPTYHISNWIDDTNYTKYLLTLDNVLIADYTDFEFPDDNYYRGDVHHLNHYGAEFFCSYIKKNGWHYETPQQYYDRLKLR